MKYLIIFLIINNVLTCELNKCNEFCVNYVKNYDVQLIFKTYTYAIRSHEVYGLCRLIDDNFICSCFVMDQKLHIKYKKGYDSIFY